MRISTLLFGLLFTLGSQSIYAQKTIDNSAAISVQTTAQEDPILSITPEQMEAIKQLDLELEAIEERRKSGVNYQSDRASLIAQREAKIKKILNSEQLERYEEMMQVMKEVNEKEREKRLTKGVDLKEKPIVID